MRWNSQLGQCGVIRLHGLCRRDFIIRDSPQMFDKRQLMLRRIDLPAKEGDTSAVVLCRVQECKCVMGGSCRSAEYAYYQGWIIAADLFHGGRVVIGDLQELRPGC